LLIVDVIVDVQVDVDVFVDVDVDVDVDEVLITLESAGFKSDSLYREEGKGGSDLSSEECVDQVLGSSFAFFLIAKLIAE
jgi:hypothetical protein